MVRRHQRTLQSFHFKPTVKVISGNFVVAKRRGIVNGVNFGLTGDIRFICAEEIKEHLDRDNIVLVNNIGYTASGELLNCNAYHVAAETAISLKADKLIFYTLNDIERLELPQWLTLDRAEDLIRQFAWHWASSHPPKPKKNAPPPAPLPPTWRDVPINFDHPTVDGVPWELSCAVMSCRAGVKRAHLIDIRDRGGMLLELYTRDGVGTMISRDFYEGCRRARSDDLEGIDALLQPLIKAAVLAPRSMNDIRDHLDEYFVLERDSRIIACAALYAYPHHSHMAEVGAFVVHPDYRGDGRGDALLEYVEEEAKRQGLRQLVLLTTRTADWFQQRGFRSRGDAHTSDRLPASRRQAIDPDRGSQLFTKNLVYEDDDDEGDDDEVEGFESDE